MSDIGLSARFGDARQARAVIDALLAAGIPRGAISVVEESGVGYEGRFLWRIVVRIVLWSIPGGAVGAGLGLVMALAGIGPAGATGIIVQVVSWLIIGHLLAGMWAGYVLLADRSEREMAPDRGAAVVVTVRCQGRAEQEAARRVLAAR